MKCSKCGAELTDDIKFCSYCGAKVEEEAEMPPIPQTENKNSDTNEVKGKILEYWNKLSKFGKLATIGITVFTILALVAFLAGRIVAGILSIVQIAIVVVALLMKKNIIKVSKSWISIVAVVVSFVLIIPYFSLFKINLEDYEKYDWNAIVLAEMLPEPESPYGEIKSNSEDYLSLDVEKTTEAQYKNYIEACKDKGFTIDAEVNGSFFYAYNDKGYKLSLNYYDYNSKMHINLDSAMEMETITWPDSEMAKLLPVPKSTTGKIYSNDEDGFSAYIGNTTIDDYNAYVKTCEEKGFNIDVQKKDKIFSAKNADSYKLSVDYKGNNVIYISITVPEFDVTIEVECVENWLLSKYDVELSIDDVFEGTVSHGGKEAFEVVLNRGKHTISFESTEDDTLDGKVEVEITKNETIKLKISCSSLGVDVELLSGTIAKDDYSSKETENTEKTESSKISVTMSEDELNGLTTADAEKKLKAMGFTVFKYDTLDAGDRADLDGKIGAVEIKSWEFGKGDFSKGDEYESDAIVVLWSYEYTEFEKTSPVSYSTNDYETATKGNTGVFSYKNKNGVYDVYWIIDFDAGYVYWFTDGNGETTCDKLKFTSGDLNSRIKVTWKNSGQKWLWYLHFKYTNSPATLIVDEHNGSSSEFTTTNLTSALKIRDTKKIIEY